MGDTTDVADSDMGTTVVTEYSTGLIRAIPMAGESQSDYAAAGVTGYIRSLYVGKWSLRCDSEPSMLGQQRGRGVCDSHDKQAGADDAVRRRGQVRHPADAELDIVALAGEAFGFRVVSLWS